MSKYKALLKTIADAEDRDQRAPDMPVGRHEVILTSYSINESKQNMGAIIRAEFLLPETGATAGFAWFPNAQGWAGTFSQQDAKAFLGAVAQSIGSDQELDDVADNLLDDEQPGRGIRLVVEAWQASKDGRPVTTKKGQPIIRAKWFPVEQTLEDIAAVRAELESTPAPAPAAKAAAPAPKQEPAPAPAPEAKRTGLFGRKP